MFKRQKYCFLLRKTVLLHVHFESDALSSDLNPRSSTHNQMKAELELFLAVPRSRVLLAVVKSYEIEHFPVYCAMSWYITFVDPTFRAKFLWRSCPALDGGQLHHTTFALKV